MLLNVRFCEQTRYKKGIAASQYGFVAIPVHYYFVVSVSVAGPPLVFKRSS